MPGVRFRAPWLTIVAMVRTALVIMALGAACGDDSHKLPDAALHDAAHDAPHDAPHDAAGSGSGTAFALEASPHDRGLEIMVVALGMVIAVGPVRRRQRRRDAL